MSQTVEYGYRPVPESTGNISGNRIERLAGLTYTEPLPRECIVYAHVYEFARELLGPSVKDLATEDALINLACLTISEYEGKQLDQAKLILTVNEWNRVVPVAYGKIPYGNRHMGYTINQKGGYISGIYMAAVDDLAVRANYPLVLQDPLGLFGLKESTIDADISRDLLASDARSSLPLGFILLHPGKLKENFEKKWQNFPELYRKLVEDIDKVVSQDSLVLSFRVGGIPDRLSKTAYDKYVDPRHKGNIGRKRAAFAWGNRLLNSRN